MFSLEQAIALYLGPLHVPSDGVCDDILAAGKVAHQWRTRGPEATAIVVHALNRQCGKSHWQIEAETGIPHTAVQRMIRRLESGEWGELPLSNPDE